jgi:ABC-type Fe3+-siderophore transport system permease subunit
MLQRWRIWGALGVVFAIVAETLNILVPDQHFIQWVLFIFAVVCFILAITALDRQKQSRDAEP